MRNVITRLGQGVAHIGFACMMLVVIVCTMHGTAAAAGPQVKGNSMPDYNTPADWNTFYVNTLTPGVEPLNVIISARSTVPLSNILMALSNWGTVGTGNPPLGCLSPEQANVTGLGFISQQESWRLDGCLSGNSLSLYGEENHARLWNQPVPGSNLGAWFISASYETLCANTIEGLFPYIDVPYEVHVNSLWHCINGGPGSIGSNGYDLAAANLATSIVQAAHKNGWYAEMRTDARPAGIGENHVSFSGRVYVVTVDYVAPTYEGTGHNITVNITSNFALASVTEDQQGNISGYALWTAPLYGSGPFTGKRYADGSLDFTSIANDGSGITITFTGTVNADGSLSGNYTVSSGQIGTWQVSPA